MNDDMKKIGHRFLSIDMYNNIIKQRFWSIAQPSGAQLPTHSLNYWTVLSGVLIF